MWTADEFKRKHNKKLGKVPAQHAATVANAVLRSGRSEGEAIRIGNYVGNHHHRKGKRK